MKTTEYGAAGRFNEFGIEKPPKDVDHAHSPGAALTGTKAPIDDRTLSEMVKDFHQVHGRKPSILHLPTEAGHYKARGISVSGVGVVMLDFAYGAPEARLE